MEPSPESLVIQTDCKTIRLETKPRCRARKPEKIGKLPSLIKITEAQVTEQLEQKVPIKTQSSR